MTLHKKAVLITGGTGALGYVVARRFLDQGADIAVSYLFEDELKRLPESFKSGVFIGRADVTEDEDVAALFQGVIQHYGKVDILINLVGGFLQKTYLRDVTTKDWESMMSINLRSMFLCSRQFLRSIGSRTYGRIISMAAMPALKPSAGRGPYAVAKSGVIMLTQVLAEELKGTGITANAIAPSILKTPANLSSMPGENTSLWVTPEEIAEMMLLLCSEQGKSINGVCMPIFGGVN
jgi:NAD(P)-dependent dehydrogenase (short-subunit alcohol dehydrogenase family)